MQKFSDIVDIKHTVLKEVAKHAFAGDLNETYFKIPQDLIQGYKPHFRCCVYHERAIIAQRVDLAMGKNPDGTTMEDNQQIVQILPSACEGCPITKITVTDNCRGCLAKKCMRSCPFGAITATDGKAMIDKEKCRECGRCVAACPYNAIVDIERPCIHSCQVGAISIDENDLAAIEEKKCINCGNCVTGCPFGAISDVSAMTNVITALTHKEYPIYAIVAPSIEGQFGAAHLASIKQAICKLGFDKVYEAAFGADMVAYHESHELVERVKEGKKLTSSCCPAFVSLVQKHFPELKDVVSTGVSPMVAAERFIRKENENAIIVFIGPCIAKKHEVASLYQDEIDFVLTFEELDAMLHAQEIKIDEEPMQQDDATRFGKGFAITGGVAKAVVQVLAERDEQTPIEVGKCTGAAECKKALNLLKAGKLTDDFLEGMYCDGGCIAGPATLEELRNSRRVFEKLRNDNTKEKVLHNVESNDANATNPRRPDNE